MKEEFVVVRKADLEELLRELEDLKRLFKERWSSFRSAKSGRAVQDARS
jgi:hypothetical protein